MPDKMKIICRKCNGCGQVFIPGDMDGGRRAVLDRNERCGKCSGTGWVLTKFANDCERLKRESYHIQIPEITCCAACKYNSADTCRVTPNCQKVDSLGICDLFAIKNNKGKSDDV